MWVSAPNEWLGSLMPLRAWARCFVVVGVAGCAALAALACAAATTYVSRAVGKRYETVISDAAVQRTPAWEDATDNPPVSARKAIVLADGVRKTLVDDWDGYTWRRSSASILFLHGTDRCVWEISYTLHAEGDSTGPEQRFSVFVLMDGTVLRPIVSDAHSPRR